MSDSITIVIPDIQEQLKHLMAMNFEKFCRLTGADPVQAAICLEREKGKSYQQIRNKLAAAGVEMPRTTVRDRCKKCAG